MSRFDWLSEYLARLQDEHVLLHAGDAQILTPAHRLSVDAEDWAKAAAVAAEQGLRYAGTWGDPDGEEIIIRSLLALDGDYLVLRTRVPLDKPELPSQANSYPGASRLERHIMDLLGVRYSEHPDARRWTRHQAWQPDQYPLRNSHPGDASLAPKRTPVDKGYPFQAITGSGVYEIPVGPVHAGIIEPGHFRFQAVGEQVLRLEQHLGYVHKGIEKLAVGRDPAALARLAARVSGDSTVAHSWAAAQAIEHACQTTPSERALHLRAIAAERERIANHLGDIGAICNDVGFAYAHFQCARLREDWQRDNHAAFGHRLLMDRVIPGGFSHDLDAEQTHALIQANHRLSAAIEPLFDIIEDHPSLDDRLLNTGHLSAEKAKALGCTGYVGKASGQAIDLRANTPYAPYNPVNIRIPVQQEGDVAARVRVRMEEIQTSLQLLDQFLRELPTGAIQQALPQPAANAVGLGLIDGWRGETLCFVRFDDEGRIARYFPRDPSWFTWPALEQLIHGNIVPDFPVCNKSVNGSYAGHDL